MCFIKFYMCEWEDCHFIHSVKIIYSRRVIRTNRLHTDPEPFRITGFVWSPMPGCGGLRVSTLTERSGTCFIHTPDEEIPDVDGPDGDVHGPDGPASSEDDDEDPARR